MIRPRIDHYRYLAHRTDECGGIDTTDADVDTLSVLKLFRQGDNLPKLRHEFAVLSINSVEMASATATAAIIEKAKDIGATGLLMEDTVTIHRAASVNVNINIQASKPDYGTGPAGPFARAFAIGQSTVRPRTSSGQTLVILTARAFTFEKRESQ